MWQSSCRKISLELSAIFEYQSSVRGLWARVGRVGKWNSGSLLSSSSSLLSSCILESLYSFLTPFSFQNCNIVLMWAWHVKMATQNLLKFTRQRIVYSFLKLWKELESVVCFFLVVHLDMRFEVGGRVAWKVALCALVRFLPGVTLPSPSPPPHFAKTLLEMLTMSIMAL